MLQAGSVAVLLGSRGWVASASTSCLARGLLGHGTHCAGTAAGTRYGVASRANILGVKTLGDDGRGSRSWQYAALEWITREKQGNVVVSMSLGGKTMLLCIVFILPKSIYQLCVGQRARVVHVRNILA